MSDHDTAIRSQIIGVDPDNAALVGAISNEQARLRCFAAVKAIVAAFTPEGESAPIFEGARVFALFVTNGDVASRNFRLECLEQVINLGMRYRGRSFESIVELASRLQSFAVSGEVPPRTGGEDA